MLKSKDGAAEPKRGGSIWKRYVAFGCAPRCRAANAMRTIIVVFCIL